MGLVSSLGILKCMLMLTFNMSMPTFQEIVQRIGLSESALNSW